MQPCLSPDLELSATDFTNGSYWFWFCLLLPGEGSVNLFIYSCLLNDKFVIPCLFHVIRKISMVGCRITFGLRPHVIRRPTIDIFPYYVNKQGITNNINCVIELATRESGSDLSSMLIPAWGNSTSCDLRSCVSISGRRDHLVLPITFTRTSFPLDLILIQ